MSATTALSHYLNSISAQKARIERPYVERFVQWIGAERPVGEVTGDEVKRYHDEQIAGEGEADETHVEPIRGLLAYWSRMAFTPTNLVPFLGLAHDGGGARGGEGAIAELGGEAYHVTLEGLQAMERQLEEARGQRPLVAEKLREAMADKDFRENAPLDAARDEQAHLEMRIRELEERLRRAVIIDRDAKGGLANVGSTVKLLNLSVEKEQTFTLVSASEVDPREGKISIESPVGLAVRNRGVGDEVTVSAPSGPIRFRVLEVEG